MTFGEKMTPDIYKNRRNALHQKIDGAIFLPGLNFAPKNYPKNCYPFRQDSHFLYFVGPSQPGLAVIILPDGTSRLYGTPQTDTDIVWEGQHLGLEGLAWASGIDETKPMDTLASDIRTLQQESTPVHYLPAYRHDIQIWQSELFRQPLNCVQNNFSKMMAEAVVLQRIKKSDDEVAQIEKAIEVSHKMYQLAASFISPGRYEYEIMGAMEGVALSNNATAAFLPIVTTHGEVLHNNRYDRKIKDGRLLLVDTGVEIPPHCYGSDITRTFPTNGVFSPRQKEIYEIVLTAQQRAIQVAGPTLANKDVHLEAAYSIVNGLKDLGLMKGDTHEAVNAGAHTLLFPHGIGHMLGLDSHDMEDLGDFVAYPQGKKPAASPGLTNLRLGRKLEPGFVITVEPGIYFIPALMDRWIAEKKHESFLDYEKIKKYRDFGGIRIEDDIVITENGCRVLGPAIPKTVSDIEAAMSQEYPLLPQSRQ